MNKYDKYLPLGTVAMLKNGKHRVMVVGYYAKLEDDENAPFYDYIACLFPEGIFTTETTMAFNHEDIEKIYYMGYVDKEVKDFQVKLKEVIANINNIE